MKSKLILAAVVALVFAAPALSAPSRHVYGSGTFVDNPGYTTASFSIGMRSGQTASHLRQLLHTGPFNVTSVSRTSSSCGACRASVHR